MATARARAGLRGSRTMAETLREGGAGMAATGHVELTGLVLEADIGTYGAHDVVPEAHTLDLVLGISTALVLVEDDAMARVFDYDPLVAELRRLAEGAHYETQERLLTRMVEACAQYEEISSLDIALRKRPVHAGTGELGVRLALDAAGLAALRAGETPA